MQEDEIMQVDTQVETMFGVGSIVALPREEDSIAEVSLSGWTLANGKTPILYIAAEKMKSLRMPNDSGAAKIDGDEPART